MSLEITKLLNNKYRLVDLTEYVGEMTFSMPGQTKPRLYHLRQFSFPAPGGEWMHQVTMESHISSHVEGPAHVVDANENKPGIGKDLASIPLEKFYGESILIKTNRLPDGAPITVEFLKEEGVRKDDIVIIGLSGHDPDRDPTEEDKIPYLSDEAVEWMSSLPIKMIAFDRTTLAGLENRPRINDPKKTPQTVSGRFANMKAHQTFIGDKSGKTIIPIIEVIGHLDRLTKKRFFLIAWPPLLGGLEAFPVRCVAFEPKE
jgi:kynurenine formamidase